MKKIIEEMAKEYAESVCPIENYCGGVYDEQRNSDLPIYTNNAKSVLEWLFTKPLSQRLTNEERERVRKMYECELELAKFYQRQSNSCRNTQCKMDYLIARDIAKNRASLLESIFGEEFFK